MARRPRKPRRPSVKVKKRPTPKTPRGKLMRRIENAGRAASALRLAGKMPGALRLDRELDDLVGKAERKGWADSAMTAEERGRRKGGA